jgi:hypothetical protein
MTIFEKENQAKPEYIHGRTRAIVRYSISDFQFTLPGSLSPDCHKIPAK